MHKPKQSTSFFVCYFLEKNRKHLQQVGVTHIEGSVEEFVVVAVDVRHYPAFLQNRRKRMNKTQWCTENFLLSGPTNQLSTKTNPPVVMSCSLAIKVLSTDLALNLFWTNVVSSWKKFILIRLFFPDSKGRIPPLSQNVFSILKVAYISRLPRSILFTSKFILNSSQFPICWQQKNSQVLPNLVHLSQKNF